MAEAAPKRGRGRPESFKPEYIDQATKLAKLGATDREAADILVSGDEDSYLSGWLCLLRQDRDGVIAAQKGRRAARRRSRLSSSPSARVRNATAARIWAALKGRSDGALFSRLEYTASDLVAHLGARFSKGMAWRNYGAWHVDHIRPCALFDQTDPAQFAACWALSNLQPLWAADNVRKGASYGEA